MRDAPELSRVRELEIYEVFDFICNFNHGSLNRAFVFFFNFILVTLTWFCLQISILPHPTIPNPSFILRFSSEVKSMTFKSIL